MANSDLQPQSGGRKPNMADLIAALRLPRPCPVALQEAIDATRPAIHEPNGPRTVTALIETVMAPFPPWSEVEDIDDLAAAWLLDAVLRRPMWAIKAGLRQVFETARFRPTPAEILTAIDAASAPLVQAIHEAQKPREAPKKPRTVDPKARARLMAMVEDMQRKVGPHR